MEENLPEVGVSRELRVVRMTRFGDGERCLRCRGRGRDRDWRKLLLLNGWVRGGNPSTKRMVRARWIVVAQKDSKRKGRLGALNLRWEVRVRDVRLGGEVVFGDTTINRKNGCLFQCKGVHRCNSVEGFG